MGHDSNRRANMRLPASAITGILHTQRTCGQTSSACMRCCWAGGSWRRRRGSSTRAAGVAPGDRTMRRCSGESGEATSISRSHQPRSATGMHGQGSGACHEVQLRQTPRPARALTR